MSTAKKKKVEFKPQKVRINRERAKAKPKSAAKLKVKLLEVKKRPGFIHRGNIQDVIDRLTELHDKRGGLNPEDIVADLENPDSPFHADIPWSDEEAAHLKRLDQARYIIRSYVYIYGVLEKGNPEPVNIVELPPFFNIHPNGWYSQSPYESTATLLSDGENHTKLLKIAWNQLIGWRKRYGHLLEFAALFNQIDSMDFSDFEDPEEDE